MSYLVNPNAMIVGEYQSGVMRLIVTVQGLTLSQESPQSLCSKHNLTS